LREPKLPPSSANCWRKARTMPSITLAKIENYIESTIPDFHQRPPVLSAARVRENWFFVSPSMCRAYQEPARASTALFAAVFAALVACDGQGFLRLNPGGCLEGVISAVTHH